jgi:hypothetical protein
MLSKYEKQMFRLKQRCGAGVGTSAASFSRGRKNRIRSLISFYLQSRSRIKIGLAPLYWWEFDAWNINEKHLT